MNRILGCLDPVLCDSFVCQTMGYEIREVPYIGLAERLGVGSSDLSKAKIIALNDGVGKPMLRRTRHAAPATVL